jgi:peptidoglycan hydrolase-like protein with peptidoglycan-binding domain
MPRTLTAGSTGPDTVVLQNTLNVKLHQIPLLKPDGIFGPKTLARVKQFQTANGLAPDGIAGPKTWAALMKVPAQAAGRTGCDCGLTDKSNQGLGGLIKSLFIQAANQAAALGLGAFAPPGAGGSSGTPIPIVGGTIKPLSGPQIALATPVYGSSLDYTKIFTTDKTGAQNRPFTIAAPDPNGGFVQIMNLGPSPSNPTLIHELMHCWQSQHSSIEAKFIASALACQGAAVAASELASIFDPSVKTHKDSSGNSDFPEQYPFSAYAYLPGSDLNAYGAEQAANAVEHGDATVRGTVKGSAANTVVAKNETSLGLLTACGDRRNSSMVY